jgi:hypothetical protein
VISGAFFPPPCNHIIHIYKKSFSGEVIDSVIFPFVFLLHKLRDGSEHKGERGGGSLSPTAG